MKLYADTPTRRVRQVLGDLLLVLWTCSWIWVGGVVHDGTMSLAKPGRQLEASANQMSSGFADAAETLADAPVVGDRASAPFGEAAEASGTLARAGRAQVRAVEKLALLLGVSIAAIPIMTLGGIYLALRIRFVREATAGLRFIDADEDLDLFALRALARQPMHVLAKVSRDPAGGWRRQDRAVVWALADLELRDSGLRRPPPTGSST
jgi:hypothetical protein